MSVPTPAAAMAIHDSLEEEVLIALVRAAWLAAERSTAIVGAEGLSPSQYNVLRILRAAGPGGLSCNEIGERMVTRDSDLTRLISGLERLRFVVRKTDAKDRRRSINRLTAPGKALLARLDHDVAAAAKKTMGHLGPTRLNALLKLLIAFAPPSSSTNPLSEPQ
ncbi:MAG TPA: MarR family transcriptional regulator [Gemmatimonadaceae bacterium]|jgi:DNA-binding MarR family transcriptional regulator